MDVLRIENDERGDALPSCEDLVTEIDADFDGTNDLLLCLGHFGTQWAVAYKCWLTRDNALTYCPSFTEIANPALDPERKEVLSSAFMTEISALEITGNRVGSFKIEIPPCTLFM